MQGSMRVRNLFIAFLAQLNFGSSKPVAIKKITQECFSMHRQLGFFDVGWDAKGQHRADA